MKKRPPYSCLSYIYTYHLPLALRGLMLIREYGMLILQRFLHPCSGNEGSLGASLKPAANRQRLTDSRSVKCRIDQDVGGFPGSSTRPLPGKRISQGRKELGLWAARSLQWSLKHCLITSYAFKKRLTNHNYSSEDSALEPFGNSFYYTILGRISGRKIGKFPAAGLLWIRSSIPWSITLGDVRLGYKKR